MSHQFVSVNWNKNKIAYDLSLWLGIILYLTTFILVSNSRFQGEESISLLILLMRAFSTCGFIMLTLILCIGPLARISDRFLPLLYNRRHFGVSFFLIAFIHSFLAIFWYHSFGDINPILSVITSGGSYQSLSEFPFQVFGLIALLLFFILATTSHDYWNALLGPMWKTLHMLIYPGYVLLVIHIGLGAMQEDDTGLLPVMVYASVALVCSLHLFAAFFKSNADKNVDSADDWIEIPNWKEIENNHGTTINLDGKERVAIFRFDENKLCAVSNVCKHQNGPLGEGKIIDGCITCPWHGYQYRPEDGCSPPPFTEKISTHKLKLENGKVFLDPNGLPPGTPRDILVID